jgi:hypothetical protein
MNSNIFSLPGEYLQGLGERAQAAYASSTSYNLLLYLFAALFLFIAVLMISGTKIDWSFLSALDPRPTDMVVRGRGSTYWLPSKQHTNLVIPEKDALIGMKDNEYSLLMDCVLYNTRNYSNTQNPYRHLIHRGSNELYTETAAGMITGCIVAGSSTAIVMPERGLPRRLNPGVFLDPNTNDILIFVDTFKGTEQYRESVRIADIPLDIPFRLGIVLNGRVLEVYLNCKLEVTKVLSGTPKAVENVWYGISGGAAAQAQLQNVVLWKFGLTGDQMRVLCKAVPDFKFKRPICESADTVGAAASGAAAASTTTAPSVDLGVSAALACRPRQ